VEQVVLTESKGSKLSVIIPTYNERENLPLLVDELSSILSESMAHEIVVVDDNSPDGTGQVADDLGKKNCNVRVVHRPAKMGLASAVIDGLKGSHGDSVVVLDADLQHSPKLLETLFNEITNGADLAIASRYIDGGGINRCDPWRKIVSKGATFLTRTLLPHIRIIRDPLSGYFMFKRSIIVETQLSGMGWKILLEILVKGKCKRIVEVPYVLEPRLTGKSKLKLKDYVAFLTIIFKLKRSKVDLRPDLCVRLSGYGINRP